MPTVKTIHEIVTPEKVYPAKSVVSDMPQALIDELTGVGAVQPVSEGEGTEEATEEASAPKVRKARKRSTEEKDEQ